ncbi:uncharacterized protein LOC143563628 isoform X2 [Bidens hawaiensis]|uniref:uncharacterized protein LOC143563628 isoform X2 n=1 Tax=Bidens hawaiensis TaxID=980011 RepID=UPI00404AB806
MEEEMINMCNIISVELAVKRELAYRAKMEALNSQNLSDLKPLVLAQGPPTQARNEYAEVAPSNSQRPPMVQIYSSSQMGPPTQARKEHAEVAPSYSQRPPMVQISSSSQMGPPTQARNEYAEVAPSNSQRPPMVQIFSSSQMGPQTQARKEHAEVAPSNNANLERTAEVAPSNAQVPPMLQISSSSQMLKERVIFSCKACNLSFTSVFYLRSHVKSQLHNVVITQMKKRKVGICNPIWCELCKSSCSCMGEVEAHNGSKHTSAVSRMARSFKRIRH